MASGKGFMHTGEPTVGERGSFDKLPDNMYPVKGITKFISKDAAGEPIFSNQYGDLKISFELGVVGQSLGLACSLRPADFYATALAFGADLKHVTAKNRLSSAIIQQTVKLINEAGKTLNVSSKNGWVRYFVGVQLPEGLYTLRYADIRRPDRTPGLEFKTGDYGPALLFEFEVVGDGAGRPTVWEGALITLNLNDPFIDSYQKGDEMVTALDAGAPLFESETAKDGNRHATKLALRWQRFIEYFAPGALEHVWQSDPAKSEFSVNELVNPQYVIKGYADRERKTAKALFQMRKNKRAIDLLELPAFNTEPVEEEEEFTPALVDLINLIVENHGKEIFEDIAPEDGVFKFTEEGRLWAGAVMEPAWKRAGLGKKKALHLMNDTEIAKLLAELKGEKPVVEEADDEEKTW
jgi:hypothetical protein